MAASTPCRLDDPSIGADHKKSGRRVATLDQLFNEIIRFSARAGVEGRNSTSFYRPLTGGEGAIADQYDLVAGPAAPGHLVYKPRNVHTCQFRGEYPGRVEGVHGVDNDLHNGLPVALRAW